MAGARFGQPMLIQPAPPQPPPHKFLPQQKGRFLEMFQNVNLCLGASARIGQLIRKLGGVAERPIVHHQGPPPQHMRVERVPSTGSVLSLNRVRFKFPIYLITQLLDRQRRNAKTCWYAHEK
jgi:hypothetical protein